MIDRKREILACDGVTPDEVSETYSYLRSIRWAPDGDFEITECKSLDDAINRFQSEVGSTFPSFAAATSSISTAISWVGLAQGRRRHFLF